MKLIQVVARSVSTGSARPKKGQAKQVARAMFEHSALPLYRLGQLLREEDGSGRTLAQGMVDGEEYQLNEIVCAQGQCLPLVPPLIISLRSANWHCPFCQSAHGTGVGVSNSSGEGANAKNLATNQFYYDAGLAKAYVISKSCYDSYVRALGYAHQIADVSEYVSAATEVKPEPPVMNRAQRRAAKHVATAPIDTAAAVEPEKVA